MCHTRIRVAKDVKIKQALGDIIIMYMYSSIAVR